MFNRVQLAAACALTPTYICLCVSVVSVSILQLLLKGVEQLKAAIHPSAPVEVAMSLRPGGAAASTPAPLLAAEQPDSSLWVNPFESMSTAPAPQRRDEVLAAISSVTLADKPAPTSLWDGEYDEEAERRAFQAAG